jgi:hypothetical protein
MKIKQKRIAFVFAILISFAFVTGCDLFKGSSGESSSSAPPTNLHVADGPGKNLYSSATDSVSTLAKQNKIYEFENTDNLAENVVIELPVDGSQDITYALVVKNISTYTQDVGLFKAQGNQRGSALEADLTAIHSSHLASNINQDLTNTRWGNLEAKREVKQALRRSFQARGGMRASKRFNNVDHSNEVLGETYPIKIITNTSGSSYGTFNCVLKMITNNVKIFVDENCLKGDKYNISDADLNHFKDEIDNIIYQLFNDNYGYIRDVDNDGKLSIVFSKQYTELGFAGLFNTEDLTGDNGDNDNHRDMIGIWAPGYSDDFLWAPGYSDDFRRNYWRAATRETIVHEMQHASNFSAKSAKGMSRMEEEWLDESLSVGAEARYRLKRSQLGKSTISGYTKTQETDSVANDNRFGSWIENSNTSMSSWEGTYAHYGQKGLFNFYLYEQLGAGFIQALHQSPYRGTQSIDYALGTTGDTRDYNALIKDWELAILNEALHSKGIIDKSQITNMAHRYNANVLPTFPGFKEAQDFTLTKNITLGNNSNSYRLPVGASAYFTLTQPRGQSEKLNKFIVAGSGYELNIRMYRLTAD